MTGKSTVATAVELLAGELVEEEEEGSDLVSANPTIGLPGHEDALSSYAG